MTIDATVLDNPRTAAADIERVLQNCRAYKKPVYFEIPVDAVAMNCEALECVPPAVQRTSDAATLGEAVKDAADMLNAAKNPVIIVGVEILRFELAAEVMKLVESAELPYATTISSKSVLPELHPQFIGLYQGAFSRACVREQMIHDGPYNDIQNWRYSKFAEAFAGATPGCSVQTEDELEKAVDAALAAKDKYALIEVVLGPTDCSDILAELGRRVRGLSK